ncbi:MAG: hypothetical protein IJ079_08110 [Lachnospiraceae bacterium]|nr:hypothetical protein [Lachnospiraceae bacterium]
MILFEIHDASYRYEFVLGYLFYYAHVKEFYIELNPELDAWSAPFILQGFVKNGRFSVDADWSAKWVSQRIIPPDRQNLGMILKENGMTEYDPYRLLVLSEGRCAQDDNYLVRCQETELPEYVRERKNQKIREILPMNNRKMMIFFKDDITRCVDIQDYLKDRPVYTPILARQELYEKARVQAGGNGITWGEGRSVASEELRTCGAEVPISLEDMETFVRHRVVDTTEAANMMNCSRQYMNQLVKQGSLQPLRDISNNKLFLKGEIEG